MRNMIKRGIVVTVVVAASTAAVGMGYAAFSTNGAGQGKAKAATPKDLVVSSTQADDLWPGGSRSVTVTVNNPNNYPISVTKVEQLSVSNDDEYDLATNPDGCKSSHVTFTPITTPFRVEPVAAGTSNSTINMSQDAGDECVGVTFTINLKAAGKSLP